MLENLWCILAHRKYHFVEYGYLTWWVQCSRCLRVLYRERMP